MAIDRNKKEECCGCMVCVDVCPTNAIKVKIDKDFFCYPVVDKILCINCNLCEKVCVYHSEL